MKVKKVHIEETIKKEKPIHCIVKCCWKLDNSICIDRQKIYNLGKKEESIPPINNISIKYYNPKTELSVELELTK